MSANLKHSSSHSRSQEEEPSEEKPPCFNLDQDESFSIYFNDKQMRVDFDDHPDSLFRPLSSRHESSPVEQPPMIKKEECI